MNRKKLTEHLNKLYKVYQYQDYGPNGLQVEGKLEIKKVGLSVSATKESVDLAVKHDVDALICHHGLFWKFHGARPIKGSFARRVSPLIKNDINLFGFHLPMDGHPKLGNAAYIAKLLGQKNTEPFGDVDGMPTGVVIHFYRPMSPRKLKKELEDKLRHPVLHSSPGNEDIASLGIITGGAK